MRRRRDLLSAGGLAVLAVAYLVANRSYPLDSLATPGPGVFPVGAGLSLLGLAACQAAAAVRAPRDSAAPADPGTGFRPSALMAGLAGYVLVAHTVGFLTASFAIVLLTSRLLGAPDWRRPAVLALGVTLAAYALFVAWLGVPLPRRLLP